MQFDLCDLDLGESFTVLLPIAGQNTPEALRFNLSATELPGVRELPLSFDTPLFRQIMDRIDSMDHAYLEGLTQAMPPDQSWELAIQSLVDLRVLARRRGTPPYQGLNIEPLSIALAPGMAPVYPYAASYAVLMQGAKDPQAAARVVAAVCRSDWGQTDGPILFSDYQPAVSKNYLENKAAMEAYEQSLANQVEKASGAERTNLLPLLEEARQRLAELEQDRFVASDEEVARYREELLPLLRPLQPSFTENLHNQEDDTMLFLFRRLVDGQISTEAFIEDADRILRMMAAEDR